MCLWNRVQQWRNILPQPGWKYRRGPPFYHNRVSHVQPATDLHLTQGLSQGVSEVQFCFTRHSNNRTKEKVQHGSTIPSVRKDSVDWRWYPVSPFSWYRLVQLGQRSASCCVAPLSETQWHLVCGVAALCVMGLETLSVVVSCQPSLNIFICYRGSIDLDIRIYPRGHSPPAAFPSCAHQLLLAAATYSATVRSDQRLSK